jgi:hypothetical protein
MTHSPHKLPAESIFLPTYNVLLSQNGSIVASAIKTVIQQATHAPELRDKLMKDTAWSIAQF